MLWGGQMYAAYILEEDKCDTCLSFLVAYLSVLFCPTVVLVWCSILRRGCYQRSLSVVLAGRCPWTAVHISVQPVTQAMSASWQRAVRITVVLLTLLVHGICCGRRRSCQCLVTVCICPASLSSLMISPLRPLSLHPIKILQPVRFVWLLYFIKCH